MLEMIKGGRETTSQKGVKDGRDRQLNTHYKLQKTSETHIIRNIRKSFNINRMAAKTIQTPLEMLKNYSHISLGRNLS